MVKKYKKTELKEFEKILLKEREKILKGINYDSGQIATTQTEASGDLSAYANHMADQGTETEKRELSSINLSRQREILYSIDYALRKISQGTYGICEKCGKLIEKKRLQILPYARFCIKCTGK
jgi:RNA polymerase-binding protein DksA|uniref:TraR/DksA family transcriptional regulator n=1 Tax=candidate division WOR-3 bacterium TaxID=2052148 RepID=A0A7C4XAQ4_UNCW3